jgi:predicted nucleic acid-binding Zn ribbon protein
MASSFAREATQRCQICGRKFAMRGERVCSIDCKQKAEALAKQQKAKAP